MNGSTWASAWLGALVSLVPAVHVLIGGAPSGLEFTFWNAPARLEVDALSAAFLLPLNLVAGLGLVYGSAYWPSSKPTGRSVRALLLPARGVPDPGLHCPPGGPVPHGLGSDGPRRLPPHRHRTRHAPGPASLLDLPHVHPHRHPAAHRGGGPAGPPHRRPPVGPPGADCPTPALDGGHPAAGAAGLRLQGGLPAPALLAAGGPCLGAQPCLRHPLRRDAQRRASTACCASPPWCPRLRPSWAASS